MGQVCPGYVQREFHRRRRATLLRLKKVNRAIQRLDEWEAAQLMPMDTRPVLQKPVLGRKALESLRQSVEEVLADMELMWGRRN